MIDRQRLMDIAREAGRIAHSRWPGAGHELTTWEKKPGDPVSEADLAVDQHLKARLLGARPDYGWASEETEDSLERLEADRVFICDPIDGTRAFVAGEPTWAHSLAVVERGEVIAAAVYLPVRDKMYLASKGAGATLNGVAIKASGRDEVEGATALGPKINFKPEHWLDDNPPTMKRSFRPSLAYRLSLIAEGRYDAMLTLRPCWEWDIAAGALISAEAGAGVSDRNGQMLKFNTRNRQTNGVVAAGRSVHQQIISRLRRNEAS